jgi:hypothetical protein
MGCIPNCPCVAGEVTRNLKQAQLDSETWHSKLDLLGCDSETECNCPSIRDMRDMRHTQEPSVTECNCPSIRDMRDMRHTQEPSVTECNCPSIRDMRDMRHTQEPSVTECNCPSIRDMRDMRHTQEPSSVQGVKYVELLQV